MDSESFFICQDHSLPVKIVLYLSRSFSTCQDRSPSTKCSEVIFSGRLLLLKKQLQDNDQGDPGDHHQDRRNQLVTGVSGNG